MWTAPLVLIVDDDARLRHELEHVAKSAGFSVQTAEDGRAALRLIESQTPDIVVTDLQMPELDGEGLIQKLRHGASTAQVPILVITSDSSRDTKLRLFALGADDFVVKAVDLNEFRARLLALARQASVLDRLTVVTQQRDDAYQKLKARTVELERLMLGLVAALERANALNDSDTGSHIQRICAFSSLLARTIGCDPSFVENIGRYAGLHDVGKVGIRDAVLKKPGKLTDEEFKEMQSHTLIGADLLQAAGLPPIAAEIASSHHERWDGTGYPHGLAGDAIPLAARIVSVVDVYDALRSKRCYKPAYDWDKSVQILHDSMGSHLEARLVEAFLEQRAHIEAIEDEHRDTKADLVWT